MNNPELLVVLLIGLILMCAPIAVQMKIYQIPVWKSIIVSTVLVLIGIYGSQLWYFVENFSFRGRSLYGAIFLAPIVYLPISAVLRIPYGKMMDFVAPAGCLTLAMVKIQCLRDGCCKGIVLYMTENHEYVRFPSQIVEMAAFLALSVILFLMSFSKRFRSTIFWWFWVLYGASRFVLNFFRGRAEPYLLNLSAGSFWSLIACIGGILALAICKRFDKRKQYP